MPTPAPHGDGAAAAREAAKRRAAAEAVKLVQPGMRLGLGSGSTAAVFLELLGQRVRDGLQIVGVPTSERTRELASAAGIPLTTLEDCPHLNLTIDGADELDPQLNLIKGGGGALLREKVVAAASERLVVIADAAKRVERLGAFPVPLAVAPFAWRTVSDSVRSLGCDPVLRRTSTGERYLTDEGAYVLDCRFGPLAHPAALADQLRRLPGVFEHGLFVGMAHAAYIGHNDGVEVLKRG